MGLREYSWDQGWGRRSLGLSKRRGLMEEKPAKETERVMVDRDKRECGILKDLEK